MFAMNDQISERQAMRLITFDLLGYSAIMIPSFKTNYKKG